MTDSSLLAEELALVAVNPDTGRHATRPAAATSTPAWPACSWPSWCWRGPSLLGTERGRSLLTSGTGARRRRRWPPRPRSLAEKAPKLKAILQHMSRGLESQLGVGTWDVVVAGLVADGALAPTEGSIRPKNDVVDVGRRDSVIARLQAAATDDGPMDPRTALLLNMTGPANLLEVVAPERRGRRHARRRIDHGLDGTDLEIYGKTVRKLIAEAAAAASGYGAGGTVAASSG